MPTFGGVMPSRSGDPRSAIVRMEVEHDPRLDVDMQGLLDAGDLLWANVRREIIERFGAGADS